MKREGHVAKPCLSPQPRTLHGRRRQGQDARALLTPLLIQMYKDTSYSAGRTPGEGFRTPGEGGGPRAPQSSVMPWEASGVPATQRGVLWGVGVQATAATDSYRGYVQDKLGACHGAGRGLYRGMQAPTPQAEHQLLDGAGGTRNPAPRIPRTATRGHARPRCRLLPEGRETWRVRGPGAMGGRGLALTASSHAW